MHCKSEKIKKSATRPFMVSVCVTTFQHERFIKDALKGIFAQKTNFIFELLLFDDASFDNTQSIIREVCKELPNNIVPRLFLQTHNLWSKGISGSRTCSYPAVQGKYVALCERDDYWTDPLKLQKQVDFLETHPECSMCMHPGRILYESAPSSSNEIYPPPKFHKMFCRKHYVPLEIMLRWNPATTASVMYRWKYYGDEFTEVFPENILPSDWFMHLLHAKDGKIGYLPDIMSVYRKHAGGMFSSLENKDAEHFKKYKELELAFYKSVFSLFKGSPQETALWEESYQHFLNRMVRCFLQSNDIESFLWFWNQFPDKLERRLELNYFKSKPNCLWERIGRIIARIGLKEEGFRKTIHRLLYKEYLP